MPEMITSESFKVRLRESISVAWLIFMRKVGHGLLPINKEASMQLQYAYILQQLLPLITFHPSEKVTLELETGVNVNGSWREIDLLLIGEANEEKHVIAVEMKCYKTIASSGGKRGATDIFMKDVYEDFQLLEQYMEEGHAHQGVSLIMNDLKNLVHPKKKEAKCWDYDTSHGTKFDGISLSTPVGGKQISINLGKSYELLWEKHGDYWFMEVEGST